MDMSGYIINWIAQILQQPGTKLETSLVIIGETRTGKTTFTNVISKLFGRYAVPNITDISHVIGMFNNVFENKRFVVINEVESVSKTNRMNLDRLKTLITDKTVSYNQKYGKQGQGDNAAHFVFTSNNIAPLPIAPDDARFVVTRVSAERKEDVEFFGELEAVCNQPLFYENLMHFFLGLPIGQFQHRRIPHSAAKETIQDACKSSFVQFINENWHLMRDSTGPQLWDLFKRFARTSNISMSGLTKSIFLSEMSQYIFSSIVRIGRQRQSVYNLHEHILQELIHQKQQMELEPCEEPHFD
jgi:hypothetical protein